MAERVRDPLNPGPDIEPIDDEWTIPACAECLWEANRSAERSYLNGGAGYWPGWYVQNIKACEHGNRYEPGVRSVAPAGTAGATEGAE